MLHAGGCEASTSVGLCQTRLRFAAVGPFACLAYDIAITFLNENKTLSSFKGLKTFPPFPPPTHQNQLRVQHQCRRCSLRRSLCKFMLSFLVGAGWNPFRLRSENMVRLVSSLKEPWQILTYCFSKALYTPMACVRFLFGVIIRSFTTRSPHGNGGFMLYKGHRRQCQARL